VLPSEKVIAVVSTFRPNADLVDRLRLLARQVHSVIVIDDGSGETSTDILDRCASAGFEVQRNRHNSGIASALNDGTRLALNRGADFVLTVDQDSTLGLGYVSSCLSAFANPGADARLGVVCADLINDSPSLPEAFTTSGLGIVREAIQSGFLISRGCLEECGLFDERLFIDDVDTEFCLRIARRGFVTVVGPNTRIEHALGEQVVFRPFGRPVLRRGVPATYQYHQPFRRYFITRNNIDLYFRYALTKPRWVASSVRHEFVLSVATIVAGPHRARHLLAAAAGFLHGLLRRRGPLSPRLQRLLTPAA